MYGYICPDCGAHLDPGERCDCEEEGEIKVIKAKEQKTFWLNSFYEESSGQLKMAI